MSVETGAAAAAVVTAVTAAAVVTFRCPDCNLVKELADKYCPKIVEEKTQARNQHPKKGFLEKDPWVPPTHPQRAPRLKI